MTGFGLVEERVFGGGASAALSVSQLTAHVAALLAGDEILADVWVRGELSGVSRPGSGHLYFGLKDSESCLSCVMWRSRSAALPFRLEEGVQVLARGCVEVYQRRGNYQLIVEELQPDGVGALYLALEQLKRRLEEEGLFAAERKRPLPSFPRRVAVVTSLSGAVVHDICTVLHRSPCPPEIVLVPAVVQGPGAEASIVAGIARANEHTGADVLIVGRGGGSAEDLWPFNSEAVARAIAASPRPVISAVGHETDFTLADFVADHRCPTPTAAAELLLQLRQGAFDLLATAPRALRAGLEQVLARERQRLLAQQARRALAEPAALVERRRQWLDELGVRLARAMDARVDRRFQQLALLGSQLDTLSPLSVLGRGFARVARLPGERPVRGVADVTPGARVRVTLLDGSFAAQVTEVNERNGR